MDGVCGGSRNDLLWNLLLVGKRPVRHHDRRSRNDGVRVVFARGVENVVVVALLKGRGKTDWRTGVQSLPRRNGLWRRSVAARQRELRRLRFAPGFRGLRSGILSGIRLDPGSPPHVEPLVDRLVNSVDSVWPHGRPEWASPGRIRVRRPASGRGTRCGTGRGAGRGTRCGRPGRTATGTRRGRGWGCAGVIVCRSRVAVVRSRTGTRVAGRRRFLGKRQGRRGNQEWEDNTSGLHKWRQHDANARESAPQYSTLPGCANDSFLFC